MYEAPAHLLKLRLQLEEEAVLLCSLAERTADQVERLRWLCGPEGMDWLRFWEKASEQQVVPLVAQVLTTPPVASFLGGATLQEARTARLRVMFYNMAVHTELQQIVGILHTRGIAAVPLKGTSLAKRLYRSLDARQTHDIDILIQESEIRAANSALREIGYAPLDADTTVREEHSFHGTPLTRQGPAANLMVELHFKLTDPRFVNVDYSQLWQRILAASSDEEPLRTLPSEELLLFLALHLPKHETMLRLVADIDRLVRLEGSTLDWPWTLQLAKRWHVLGMLYFALHSSQRLLGTPVPPSVMQQLKPAIWRRAAVGLLAGPQAILRPPDSHNLSYNRFRLAYCAMLWPNRRSVEAYVHYVFPPLAERHRGIWMRATQSTQRLAHGFAWTGMALGSSLKDRWPNVKGEIRSRHQITSEQV